MVAGKVFIPFVHGIMYLKDFDDDLLNDIDIGYVKLYERFTHRSISNRYVFQIMDEKCNDRIS